MNESYIRNVVEAALLAAGKALQLAELGQLFDENTRPKVDEIRAALAALEAEYLNRAVEVKETAAGFRIQVRREFSAEISRLWPERPARYSRALLETLALVAYRQPITRAEIEAVRGVAVNPNIVKTLIERNWVRVVGHRDVPGRPELLGTTRDFLDYFGLRSLDELPPLAELKTMGDYNLQLELPNAGAVGVEPKADGGLDGQGVDGVVAAVAIAGDGELGDESVSEVELVESVVVVAGDVGYGADSKGGGPDSINNNGERDAMLGAAAVAVNEDARNARSIAETDAATDAADAVAHQRRAEADADGEAEADRTLSGGEGTPRASAESDDSETPDGTPSSESLEALDDPSDDEADDDELSADGNDSRELVAGPRDVDD